MAVRTNIERALDAIRRIGSFSDAEKEALAKAFRTALFPGNWSIDDPDDGDTLIYNAADNEWTAEPPPGGDFLSLSDTPASYVSGNRLVRINDAMDGLEFHQPLIDDNVDVVVTTPSEWDVLRYDSVQELWVNDEPLVTSVNGYTGEVVLDADDILDPEVNGTLLVYSQVPVGWQPLPVGMDGQVLTANSGVTDGGMEWANSPAGFADPMTTRGDIIIKDAANATERLPVGTVGQVLSTDGTDVFWDDSIAGVSEFIDLNDVPASYAGQANKFLRVNAAADAIEFTAATPVTQVTATAPITSSGGTTPDIGIVASSAVAHGYMSSTQFSKLAGIENGADVTDAVNVAAAGAYMKTVTISTSAPSGGANGDVWYQVV